MFFYIFRALFFDKFVQMIENLKPWAHERKKTFL